MQALRTATPADIAAMWALRRRAVRETCATHYPPDVTGPWAAAPPPASYAILVDAGFVVIVEDDAAVLGFGVLNPKASEIDAVFVAPDAGRRGVGRQLMHALEQMAMRAGCSVLHLSAALNAVPFYEAAGFVRLRDAPYPHPSGVTIDSVMMEKRLGPGGRDRVDSAAVHPTR